MLRLQHPDLFLCFVTRTPVSLKRKMNENTFDWGVLSNQNMGGMPSMHVLLEETLQPPQIHHKSSTSQLQDRFMLSRLR